MKVFIGALLSAMEINGKKIGYSDYDNNDWLRVGFRTLMCCDTRDVMRNVSMAKTDNATYNKFLHSIRNSSFRVEHKPTENHIIILYNTADEIDTYAEQTSRNVSVIGANVYQTYLKDDTGNLISKIFSNFLWFVSIQPFCH